MTEPFPDPAQPEQAPSLSGDPQMADPLSSLETAATPTRQDATRSRRKIVFVAAVLVAFVLGVSVGALGARAILAPDSAVAEEAAPPFAAARSTCAPSSPFATLGDAGKSLDVRGMGEKDLGVSIESIACFLRELKVPDSVVAEMTSTRALDGKQTGQWDNIHASWNYHPDHGLHIIFSQSR